MRPAKRITKPYVKRVKRKELSSDEKIQKTIIELEKELFKMHPEIERIYRLINSLKYYQDQEVENQLK